MTPAPLLNAIVLARWPTPPTCVATPSQMRTPAAFPIGAVPAASVPMKLPATRVPLEPDNTPTYKKWWTIPGGQMEANGESPWEACRREAREECGLEIVRGHLICVDFLRPKPKRPGGMRFLFDCGIFADQQLGTITLQEDEVSKHRFEDPVNAAALLSGPVRRRVSAAIGAGGFVYLEDGQPVPAVTGS